MALPLVVLLVNVILPLRQRKKLLNDIARTANSRARRNTHMTPKRKKRLMLIALMVAGVGDRRRLCTQGLQREPDVLLYAEQP